VSAVPRAGLPPRSRLAELVQPDAFCFATGIEDTFIAEPWPGTGRTLDEYELTGHYARLAEDLARIPEVGAGAARYGLPWYRLNPAEGRWDFAFADQAIGRLLELGVEPIVDLVHYGTPRWLERSFLHPDFPRHAAEYAARVAERYRGRVRWYTPLNEPRIAAWYCGMLGWWPPGARGWRGFAQVLLALCRGIQRSARALREVDPEIVCAHADATDLYESDDPALASEVAFRQALVFLPLDLVTGRVAAGHALFEWLLAQGASRAELEAFAERPLDLEIVGINLYPMFTAKRLRRANGRLRIRSSYADAGILERLAGLYADRYGCPVMVTETASWGRVARRRAWLEESMQAVRRARAKGVPLVGYTWWPLFGLVAWAYRQGRRPLADYLLQMGLFDLDPVGLERRPTPLVDRYRELAASGAEAAGRLAGAPRGGEARPGG
jgi:beta-glucosidase/6-phospho-beta-glucosidase/beta-galactosidase